MHCVVRWTVTLLLVFAPHAVSAVPLISEAFYDAVRSDNGLSFVELYGEPGSSLDGLFLEGINGANGSAGPTIALSGWAGAPPLLRNFFRYLNASREVAAGSLPDGSAVSGAERALAKSPRGPHVPRRGD
jgi:hypothetical protein